MTHPFVASPSWQREPLVSLATERTFGPAGAAPASQGSAAAGRAVPAGAGQGVTAGAGQGVSAGAGQAEAVAPTQRPGADLSVLGPLEPFALDGPVTDLFVNGDRGLWIDRGAGAEHEPEWAADEAAVRALAVRLIARGGRHIDEATPAVDVRLGAGIRVHAVLPPVSATGTTISVRVPRAGGFSLAALARAGLVDASHEAALRQAIGARKNVLITGAGGTGKTTLLGALLGEAPERERLVVIEDVAELQIDHPHVVSLEARQANLEGTGRVGLDALLREALRMRPDRLVVGECRGAELRELLAALNTGHDGGAGTLHANSLADVPARLEALGAIAGLTPDALARQTVSAFDLVLHLDRIDGRRRLAQMGRFEQRDDRLTVDAI
ncbi:TadA family conjugal transfer-associated ATPase [Agromyces laixinhei]|uniref:TadA family conjugal transfer-associated ATPase n=1 Tax=Agromyces laixinhei TaxID=2585717 RepID=UPI0012EE332D|nr:TadA family conjugal transfer-associated ATPase [Agromyces laixinhei]